MRGCGIGPVRATEFSPLVEGGQGGGIEEDRVFGGELAEWDVRSQVPVGHVVDDAIDFQVEQLGLLHRRMAASGRLS